MIFEPKNFRSGESRKNRIAQQLDRFLQAAEFFHDLVAFSGSGRIAPKLGGPDYFSLVVERHEAMLLSTHPNRHHVCSHCFGLPEPLPDGAGSGFPPGVRMLFFGAGGQIWNQIVSLRGGGQDFSIARIDHQDLGRLGPAIDAYQEISHKRILPKLAENEEAPAKFKVEFSGS